MAKEEVIGGLKNAIDRGQSLDAAIKSLTNSGYDPAEVTAAAQTLNSGVTASLQPNNPNPPVSQPAAPGQPAPATPPVSPTQPVPQQPAPGQPVQQTAQPPVKKKSSATKIIFILFILFIIFLVGGGVTLTLLFPDLVADLIG